MSISDMMNVVAGGLQFFVAAYALRLNRIFGPDRVGWSLFCAFSLLALLHLARSLAIFKSEEQSAMMMEATYALISLLLLTGMAHIEALFKVRRRLEQEEIRLRARLEAEVEKKTQHLTRAIEALQAEIDERKRMAAEVASHVQLLESSHKAVSDLHGGQETLSHIRF